MCLGTCAHLGHLIAPPNVRTMSKMYWITLKIALTDRLNGVYYVFFILLSFFGKLLHT